MLREMMFGLDEAFDYAQCADCESLFIDSVPAHLAEYYSTKYYSFDIDPEAVLGRFGVAQAVRTLGRSSLFGRSALASLVQRYVPARRVHTLLALFDSIRHAGLPRGRQSRLLDVGCGSGALVYALSLVGLPAVTGVDPYVDAPQDYDTGARVLRAEAGAVEGIYDLIMLHHCLEHVADPQELLVQLRRRLAPDGRILVRMPTVSSAAYARYGTSWVQLDPPRHLSLMSRQGVQRLASRSGLVIEKVLDDSTSFQFWGSEQLRRSVPLVSENSHFLHPRRSGFTRAQLRAWDAEAAHLNAQGRGDQAMWVLRST